MMVLAFLAGVLFMCISIACATWVALVALERPAVRVYALRGFLDGVAPHFPALVVVDIEGAERLVQFSAFQESMLRVAQGRVDRAERQYDA